MKSHQHLLSARGGLCALAASAAIACAVPAQAVWVMHQPVSAVVNSGGTLAGSNIAHTFDLSGLMVPYTSGVDHWSTYLGGPQLHSAASSTEWFSAQSGPVSAVTDATVTYDLGVTAWVGGVALWNEDSGGVGTVSIRFGDVNGVFGAWNWSWPPVDHSNVASYGFSAWGLSAPNSRYLQLHLQNCPQPNANTFQGCSLGEVAVSVLEESIVPLTVPEPGSLTLAGLSCLMCAAASRRAKKESTAAP